MQTGTFQTLMFSPAELPARDSVSPDSERVWMTRVLNSPSPMLRLLQDFAPAGWSLRTSPASFPAVEDETLRNFWARSQAGKFLPLRKAGKTQASSKASPTPTGSHGGCLTLNTAEFPSAAVACSLSDILETGAVPPRYYLSATACRGILRRAEKRGKTLPIKLRLALEQVAGDFPEPEKHEAKTR